jgi:hypothetical protein
VSVDGRAPAVQLSNTLCLPALATPDAVYAATWSGTLLAKLAGVPPWRPAPPPLAAMREVHGDVAARLTSRP